MIPMSGDEVFVLAVTAVAGTLLWIRWLWHMTSVHKLYRSLPLSMVPISAVVLSALLLYGILKTLASHDVREDFRYVLFYIAFGAAWVGIVLSTFPWLGISPRDDVAERRNPAAALAVAGGIMGATLCYALAKHW